MLELVRSDKGVEISLFCWIYVMLRRAVARAEAEEVGILDVEYEELAFNKW